MAHPKPKSANPTSIQYSKPFDEEDADLILRSSDNAHFRVHKLILRKASPVFDTMLTMPSNDDADEVQTVCLEEDSAAISGFLHLCYPLRSPEVGSLDTVSTLLGICDKYQAYGAAERLSRSELHRFLDEDPLRVYILACRASILEEARRAAYSCLTLPLETLLRSNVPELRHLSAPLYRSLLVYYDKCRQTAAGVYTSGAFPWIVFSFNYCWFVTDGHSQGCGTQTVKYASRALPSKARSWWCKMMSPIETYLMHEAPPLSPRLVKAVVFPTESSLECIVCGRHYYRDSREFLAGLEAEITKQVKKVEFRFVE